MARAGGSTENVRQPKAVWHDSKHIKERTKYLLDNLTLIPTDVAFCVGPDCNKKDVSAHRFILAIGSEVFHGMFYGKLREKTGTIIRVPDVDPDAFQAMIRYLYSEDISMLTMDGVMDNLYCAKKYLLTHWAD